MKISTYHKARCDNVALIKLKLRRRKDGTLKEAVNINLSESPDMIYASIVFKKNKHMLDGVAQQYPDIDIGGSGYDLEKELPDYIENIKPDYSLYPTNDTSIGFSSRGCFRKCHFCIVDQKEGAFRRTQHPQEWYDQNYKKITFLDNNILINKEWFMEITSWCTEKKLDIQFNQGLDIRLVDGEIAKRLLEMPKHGMINFAWDDIKTEQAVRKGIDILKQAGFTKNKLREKVQFYVYVDSDDDYESGVYRCRELKKLSCNSYVMYNIDNERTPRITNLTRWSKGKMAYWSFDVSDYKKNIRATKTIRSKSAKA
jgi:hypothetical protein